MKENDPLPEKVEGEEPQFADPNDFENFDEVDAETIDDADGYNASAAVPVHDEEE